MLKETNALELLQNVFFLFFVLLWFSNINNSNIFLDKTSYYLGMYNKGSYRCGNQLPINEASMTRNQITDLIIHKNVFYSKPHFWEKQNLKVYMICPTSMKIHINSVKIWKMTL